MKPLYTFFFTKHLIPSGKMQTIKSTTTTTIFRRLFFFLFGKSENTPTSVISILSFWNHHNSYSFVVEDGKGNAKSKSKSSKEMLILLIKMSINMYVIYNWCSRISLQFNVEQLLIFRCTQMDCI